MDFEPRDPMRVGATLAPFAATAVLTWIAVIVGSSIDWLQYAIATVLLLLAGAIGTTVPVRLSSQSLGRILMSLVFLTAVGLLRNSAGGISSGAATLALIPVFYTALYCKGRSELFLVLGVLAIFYLAPILLVGPPAYPHTQYRAVLLSITISSIIGLTTQQLVANVRHQAGEARVRGRMLEEVSDAIRRLFSSSEARADVCKAAMSISHASVAILYEPIGRAGAMRSSAMAGPDADPIEISPNRPNAVSDAFLTGRATLITHDVEAHVGSPELWRAAGSPQSVLYEPLIRGSEPIGVLVVGWPGYVKAGGPRATVAALLAHEAAAVIQRADVLHELTDMAQTDSLTGLLNRRAWDIALNLALSEGSTVTVAMLDLDHFKEFNDAYGHPAGDRLLKETAAMWRDQLRTGDLLARLGGEEFGLLLVNCDAAQAREVIDRLRTLVCGDRTCSAGFAERTPGESADSLMARADMALYQAKSSGRNRACMSA